MGWGVGPSLHRRRINSEEKAKIITAVLWAEFNQFIQFLAGLSLFPKDDLEKRMNIITAAWRNRCFEKNG